MAKLPKTVKAVNKVLASLKKKVTAMEKRKKMLAKAAKKKPSKKKVVKKKAVKKKAKKKR